MLDEIELRCIQNIQCKWLLKAKFSRREVFSREHTLLESSDRHALSLQMLVVVNYNSNG